MPGYRANYPATVAEVLDDGMTFKPDALRAVKSLARSKPWQGTPEERLEKLRWCLAALIRVYRLPPTRLEFGLMDCYNFETRTIMLTGNLSVLTFLHEFGHARGFDERKACRWSINMFRRCFPRSYARLTPRDHTLVRDA